MLQSACSLMEGKSFGGRRTFASDKAILMSTLVRLIGSLKENLDRKMIAKIFIFQEFGLIQFDNLLRSW